MGIDYKVLHNELVNDPNGIGYSVPIQAGDFNTLTSLLNAPSGKLPVVAHAPIASNDFMASVKPTESLAITSTQWMQINAYLASGSIDIGDTDVQAWVNQLWPAGSAPITNGLLTGMATRQQSPIEFLFGLGTVIGFDDVVRAYKSGQ